jgi:hypothetical protein
MPNWCEATLGGGNVANALKATALIRLEPKLSGYSRIPLCLQGTERFAVSNCRPTFRVKSR